MDLRRRCSNETEVGPSNEQDRPTSTRCPIRPRKRNPWQKVIDLLAMAKEVSVHLPYSFVHYFSTCTLFCHFQEDQKENHTLALKLYECALEFFLLAIDQDAKCDKATQSFVWDSCLECLERVEDLRKKSPI